MYVCMYMYVYGSVCIPGRNILPNFILPNNYLGNPPTFPWYMYIHESYMFPFYNMITFFFLY